jgi:FMN phosphatase YigB (HAD superfamily)
MIKTVVFDLGKVLVDFDYSIAARRIAAQSKMTVEELTQFGLQSALLMRYELGLLTTEQFHKAICDGTGFCGGIQEFGEMFGDIFTPIDPMIQLHAALRQQGFPTFLFSNTNELAVRHIRRHFPFFGHFTGHVLSYEHGAMKPEAKLYELVEAQSGCQGAELLYLDDRPENIDAGAVRGWQVILQETPGKTERAIREFGLLPKTPAIPPISNLSDRV